jgi:hypothetical protein
MSDSNRSSCRQPRRRNPSRPRTIGRNRKLERCRTRLRDRQASNRRACCRSDRSHTSTNCSRRCKANRSRSRGRCRCRCSSPPGSCRSYDRRMPRQPEARMPDAATANGSRRTAHAPAQYATEGASRLAVVADLKNLRGEAFARSQKPRSPQSRPRSDARNPPPPPENLSVVSMASGRTGSRGRNGCAGEKRVREAIPRRITHSQAHARTKVSDQNVRSAPPLVATGRLHARRRQRARPCRRSEACGSERPPVS